MSTLNDVAREAKVSTITVSRVINNPEKVKPITRERVQRAMDKINYVQNPVAKALVSKRVGIIDVYVPESIDLSNPFIMHLLVGISEELSKQMYSFLIIRDRKHEHRCDGYIVTGLLKDEIHEMYQYALERKRPIALFGHTDNEEIDCIDVDNIEGVRMITEYVLQNGHKNLAMINVNEEKDYTLDRYEGYCRALQEAGNPSGEHVMYAENSVQGGYEAALRILRENNETTAMICATDIMAIGAIRAVTELGLKVPQDISVTGYDGLGHHLLSSPAITTVCQPVYEIGRLLAQTLLKRIRGEERGVKQSLVPALFLEHSVAGINKSKEDKI
ncbi:MAG TPA: LacI family transcriptional regulator [Clostridiales bacterium]|nr:LacI family transcriptional regulator [Clostridiales bacterium]